MHEEAKQSYPKSENTPDPRISAMLSYLLGVIGGVVFYATSKNSFVRFHAMQSILFSAVVAAVYIALIIIAMLIPLILLVQWIVWLAIFALWLLIMIRAYQGEEYKLPVIGEMAKKYAR